MKYFKLLFVVAILCCATTTTRAFDLSSLKGILTNGNASSILDNIIQKDDVDVSDIVGSWKSCGPAVSFKSENLLEKAGGVAAASALESKLNPYYKKAGLENAVFSFAEDGSMTVTLKSGRTITGKVYKGTTKGTLIFDFSKLQSGSKLTKVTAYVSKGTMLSIMFDVSKLTTIVNAVAKVSGNATLGTASSLLNKYKGIYAGFKFERK